MSVARKKLDKQSRTPEPGLDQDRNITTHPSDTSLNSRLSTPMLIPEPISNITVITQSNEIHYKNTESFAGDLLSSYPRESLFITNDQQFCFVVDELAQILVNQNRLYNPYTNKPFSLEDSQRLLKLPQIQNQQQITRIAQQYNASKISRQTIKMLKELAEELLNKQEILRERGQVPRAQNAYEKFADYYQSLEPEERTSLNNYWIDSWGTVIAYVGSFTGMKATTFGKLYQELNGSCVHSIGGSIAQLVYQLAPDTKFKAGCFISRRVFESIKNNNDFESSQYVTATVENRGILRRIKSRIEGHPILTSLIFGAGGAIGYSCLLNSAMGLFMTPFFAIGFAVLKTCISNFIIKPIRRHFHLKTDFLLTPSDDDNNDQPSIQQNNSATIIRTLEEESSADYMKIMVHEPPQEQATPLEQDPITLPASTHLSTLSFLNTRIKQQVLKQADKDYVEYKAPTASL